MQRIGRQKDFGDLDGEIRSRRIFSTRSRKPAGMAVPPLRTMGKGRLILSIFPRRGEGLGHAIDKAANQDVVVDAEHLLGFVGGGAVEMKTVFLDQADVIGAFAGDGGGVGIDVIAGLGMLKLKTGMAR